MSHMLLYAVGGIALAVVLVMLVAKSRRGDAGDYVAQHVLTRIKNDYRDNGERR